jgi:uncharacterized membrane protein
MEKSTFIESEEEKENGLTWLNYKTFRIVLLSIFTALAVVLGYFLAALPNIELFTLTIFLSGFIIGKKEGIIVGLFSSFMFAFFNPYGASPLPLFVFQLLYYSFVGLVGGVTRGFLNKKEFFKPEEDLYNVTIMVLFGFIGGTLTFVFDLCSTLITSLIGVQPFLPTYILGIGFTTIHLIGNTLGFVFILPGLIQLIYKLLV